MIRTTVRLEEDLFKDARKKAIDEGVAFADILNEALIHYLGKPRKIAIKKSTTNDFLQRLAVYKLKGGPKDLAKNHDKYAWE
jgi:uncharacterized protein YggE